MVELEGSVAIVTGAAYGIGRATALAMAGEGTDVVVADIFEEGLATVAEIERRGGRALFVKTDVADRAKVEALAEAALAWRDRVDILVSNAAVAGVGAPHVFSGEDWERMLGVDLYGSIWAMRAVLPHMLARGRGHLSFVTSGWGFRGSADDAPYSVDKFGLVGLAESLAVYLKDTNLSVSLIVPGAIGGPHTDTTCIAGAEAMSAEEIEAIKAERRAMAEGWPPPEVMAEMILAGWRAGRFYIIQEGVGHEDWLGRFMREKWADPEAFMATPV